MKEDAEHRRSILNSVIFPVMASCIPLTFAIIVGMRTEQTYVNDGVNEIIGTLSGRSEILIGGLVPQLFALSAGMVATVNPCGFAMLPAYLGLYLNSNELTDINASHFHQVTKALIVSVFVTSGFVLLFGITGLLIGAGVQSLTIIFPWIGLGIGVTLTGVGAWLLRGGRLYTGIAERAAFRIGNPTQVNLKGYFLFGVSYGTASLSCTLPIFLAVIGSTLATKGVWAAINQFLLYSLGMGLVIVMLTVSIALFKEAIVGIMRKTLPYMQPISAALMILAGTYIVFYWLTIGGLAEALKS